MAIKKGRIMKKKMTLLISISIIVLVSAFIIPKYKLYKFYKSERFAQLSISFSQTVNMYFYNFLKYPSNGNELIKFYSKKEISNDIFGLELPSEIISHGIGIKENKNDSLICIYSFSDNKKDDSNIALNLPDEINFIDFLLNNGDILICCRTPISLCDIKDIRLYSNKQLINNYEIKRKIKKDIKNFIIRNTSERNKVKKLVNPKEYYFYGIVNKEDLNIDVVCNPDSNNDLNSVCDSLELILFDVVNKDTIDEFYFPLTLYDIIY